ncbi:TonB-dependent receptor plug domain-containing protein [Sulfitobacter sp.]|uniref:TonB-dependent receptor plug domain-containing protein n=1 Tax=Sulfitobacter sp. TaxID=1903071 RepID=UPI001B68216F|nr:TonB-dependent receptor [Sulfitobacter sp.]
MFRTSLLSSAALIALCTSAAVAQETLALDEIIVSGGLSPIAANAYGRAATVITAQDIEDRGITNVADALRSLPGVQVSGVSSNFTQVRIRGGEANHTLVLIDGVEAAGGDGEYVFSGLETANIERIEVLRGPQSVYYGSNASSGVINIITRKGDLGETYSTSLEVGSATIATAFIARRNERGGVSLSLAHTNDAGYDQSGDGGEKDGLERNTAILSGDYLVTDDLKLGFVLRTSDENYDFDSTSFVATDPASYVVDDPSQYADRKELTAQVYAEYMMMGGRLTHRLAYETTRNRQSSNGAPLGQTESEALKYRLSYGLDGRSVAETDHLLNLLVERQSDTSDSNPAYNRAAQSIALEYRGAFSNGVDLQAGARFDDNDVFENATTWNVGLGYTLAGSGIRLHASAGTGVVNPSYFELFANAFGYTGNPNLRPEENKSFDIGAEFPVFEGRGTIDVTYFNEKLTDEISSLSLGGGAFTYENQTGESTREGVEISGNMQATDTVSLRMSYTYLDAKNPNGSVEIRRPRHEFTLGATVETFGGRGSVSADLRHVSANYDTQFFGTYPTIKLPSYTTVDVAADYDLNDRVTLTGRITNLFDDDAVDVWGYASRGRAAYIGVRANF